MTTQQALELLEKLIAELKVAEKDRDATGLSPEAFAVFYVLPYSAGAIPSDYMKMSVLSMALIPLTLMWFGLGETQKVMFIFLASVAFVLFDSASAVGGVPDNYLDAAYTLGARFVWRRGAVWGLLAGAIYCLAMSP